MALDQSDVKLMVAFQKKALRNIAERKEFLKDSGAYAGKELLAFDDFLDKYKYDDKELSKISEKSFDKVQEIRKEIKNLKSILCNDHLHFEAKNTKIDSSLKKLGLLFKEVSNDGSRLSRWGGKAVRFLFSPVRGHAKLKEHTRVLSTMCGHKKTDPRRFLGIVFSWRRLLTNTAILIGSLLTAAFIPLVSSTISAASAITSLGPLSVPLVGNIPAAAVGIFAAPLILPTVGGLIHTGYKKSRQKEPRESEVVLTHKSAVDAAEAAAKDAAEVIKTSESLYASLSLLSSPKAAEKLSESAEKPSEVTENQLAVENKSAAKKPSESAVIVGNILCFSYSGAGIDKVVENFSSSHERLAEPLGTALKYAKK